MKKQFLGIAVVAIALTASAFTNVTGPTDRYVELVEDIYDLPSGPYDPFNCIETTSNPCAYKETAAGTLANVGQFAPFDEEEIIEYTTEPTIYLEPVDEHLGLYVEP